MGGPISTSFSVRMVNRTFKTDFKTNHHKEYNSQKQTIIKWHDVTSCILKKRMKNTCIDEHTQYL